MNNHSLSSNKISRDHPPKASTAIPLSAIVIAVIAFVIGILVTLLFLRILQPLPESFSASGLITLIFGIALSAAAIVLAVVAISLGKASEQAMIERSDDSIRLQNEVFVRTTDALQRIESSTGVTEKRIEDIISGRVGAISERIVDRLVDDRGIRTKSRKDIEKEVRESVLQGVSRTTIEPFERRSDELSAKRDEARTRYDDFNNTILLVATNIPDVETVKIGRGLFDTQGFDLADGVFEKGNQIVAVCTFSSDELLEDKYWGDGAFQRFLLTMGKEIFASTFTKVLLVFEPALKTESKFVGAFEEFKKIVRPEITSAFLLMSGESEDVKKSLIEFFQSISGA